MHLASVAVVREAIGFDDMADINAAISSALLAAEAQIAATLRTDFAEADHTDLFFVLEPTFKEGSLRKTEFLTSHGFISSYTIEAAVSGSKYGDGPIDVESVIIVNKEAGHFRDPSTQYNNTQVRIKYKAGFPVDANDPDQYDLTKVPVWLQTCAKLLALINLATQPSLTEANVSIDTAVLSKQYDALISGHRRYAPMALLPI